MIALVRDRFAYIDSLRAIAALLVIWLHVTEHFHKLPGRIEVAAPPSLAIAQFVDTGRIGVLVFFLVSGFLIPSSLKGTRWTGARTFVIRRLVRLYPLYWLSIPLALASTWWLFGKGLPARDIALNFTMLQGLFGATDIQGLYWTLRVELYFYAICLGLFVIDALRRDWVLGLLAVGCPAVVAVGQLLTGPKIHFFEIWPSDLAFLGFMFTGALWRRGVEGDLGRFGKGALVASTGFFLLVFPSMALARYLKHGFLHPDHARLFFGYALAMLIFVAGVTVLRLRWRVLAWLGVISYSLYLLHPVVLYTLYWAIDRQPAESALRNLPLSAYLAIVVALAVPLSALTYALVEAPMIRLGARLSSRGPPETAGDQVI